MLTKLLWTGTICVLNKPTKNNPEGGILKREAFLHKSNVAYYTQDSNEISRIGHKIIDNKKFRYLKKNRKTVA